MQQSKDIVVALNLIEKIDKELKDFESPDSLYQTIFIDKKWKTV